MYNKILDIPSFVGDETCRRYIGYHGKTETGYFPGKYHVTPTKGSIMTTLHTTEARLESINYSRTKFRNYYTPAVKPTKVPKVNRIRRLLPHKTHTRQLSIISLPMYCNEFSECCEENQRWNCIENYSKERFQVFRPPQSPQVCPHLRPDL